MANTSAKHLARLKRHRRVRKDSFGTSERPRLFVFRSNKNIYAQAIDDTSGKVIASVSTIDAKLKKTVKGNSSNKQAAEAVGKLIAEQLTSNKVEQITFDRGGYLYHGRVKALADAARKAGLKF